MTWMDTISTVATTPAKEKDVKKGKSRVQLTEGTARWLRMRAEFEDKDVDQLVRQMIQERNLLKPMNLQPGIRFEPDVRTALYSTLAFIVTLDLIVTFYSGLVIPITLGVVLILDAISFSSIALAVIFYRVLEKSGKNAVFKGIIPAVVPIPLMLVTPFFVEFPAQSLPFVLVMLVGTAISLSFYFTLNLLLRSARVDLTSS